MPEIHAWTDGACSGNPGPGGWGVLMRAFKDGEIVKERELKGGEAETTNNRMELLAAINALEALSRPTDITITTDSAYVKNGVTGWIYGWKRNGWKTAAKKPVKNVDLWQRLDEAQATHNVTWKWIKGHAGHAENEKADELARAGMAPFKEVGVMTLLAVLDYASVIVFAISGALAASRAQLDLVGFAFLACLTAVGGGTLRDVLLNRDAVFWIAEPSYILIACLVAAGVFFTAHRFENRMTALMWADAVALSVAVSAGAGVALKLGQPPVIVALMGVATGCFGGLMRDVVCNEVPLVLKQGELYASAALLGAMALLGASYFDFPPVLEFALCGALTFTLRAGSLIWGWSLPVYKSRPPRS